MKKILYSLLLCLCLVSCVKETNTKLQELNNNLKKYHSIDIFHKDIETEKDVLDFIDSLNYFVKHNYPVKSKSAFVKEKESIVSVNDTFWANVVLSGNSPTLNKYLILTYEQKNDTINYDEKYDLYSFKIRPIKKGINKYEGRIYEGEKEHWFSGEFLVR
jgi:hypothetical protein